MAVRHEAQAQTIFGSAPPLRISEVDGRVLLGFEGFGYVAGATLQEAADQLVERMLVVAMSFRAGGFGPLPSDCCVDTSLLDFMWKLGEHVASGGEPATCSSVPTSSA